MFSGNHNFSFAAKLHWSVMISRGWGWCVVLSIAPQRIPIPSTSHSFSSFFSLQVHWLNHNFPCSQFMHKNLAWKCVLASVHGALIESKVMRWKTISSDRLLPCRDKTATRCASERLISYAGEFDMLNVTRFGVGRCACCGPAPCPHQPLAPSGAYTRIPDAWFP